MVRRASTSLLLGVLLAASAAPSSGVILCIAEDGHVSLELALPGTTRCDERDCDPHAAAVDDRSCRDIPLLSIAESMVPPTSVAAPLLHATATAVSPAAVGVDDAPRSAPPSRPPLASAPTAHLRSVVLTL